ncbi:MAG: FAD-binding protein [Christensenellaceae bacterium]|nr:FAD-binding protein [Christensenellaceae bacterium]
MISELTIKNIVIGSGAAGLSAALRLWEFGEKDTAVITEGMNSGTSRNTGSDKQTYYKLSLSGGDPDSILDVAEDIYSGGAVDGDTALVEAAYSARCFFKLVELGVPFPSNEFGEYTGYKTDHDKRRRATSAGPYTSKLMTEALERALRDTGITVMDRMQAVKILCGEGRVMGTLLIDLASLDENGAEEPAFTLIWAENVILATGGPAGLYSDVVYPVSQQGSSGMAFEAGVRGKNLTEWQFGIASTNPRWNVSGTYMQVLPRFVSTDSSGNDEKEFLFEYCKDTSELLSLVFLKGYQWPFDVDKLKGGSSVIDLLVYLETVIKGRRVFLDFMNNPGRSEISFEKLSPEAYSYLKGAGALFGTPVTRLKHMNPAAVAFFADHGVDLERQRLEITVCAQHNNGGLSCNADWETDIKGLFAVGELNGSHGIRRPGGSALNAGQAGALRAAETISLRTRQKKEDGSDVFLKEKLRAEAEAFSGMYKKAAGRWEASELADELRREMSAAAGLLKDGPLIKQALMKTEMILEDFSGTVKKPALKDLGDYYRLYDMLLARRAYLFAMDDYISRGGGSRGSGLYRDDTGELPAEGFPEEFRFRNDQDCLKGKIQETGTDSRGELRSVWREARPIPIPDDVFENQWRAYRKRHGL